jgi:alanine racemase
MLSHIEISKENLIHNIKSFCAFIHPYTQIAAVIKANAYGHGQNEVAQILGNYVDYFQVDDFLELKLLKKVSQKPVLVLGYIEKEEIEEAIELGSILAVYDFDQIESINEIAKKLEKIQLIHICVDSLLGRDGFLITELEDLLEKIKDFKNIKIDGVYSHFANIEDTADFSHARKQIEKYEKALEIFRKFGYGDIKRHMSATSGVLVYEKKLGINDIVRVGIGVYGMWPARELRSQFSTINDQRSVSSSIEELQNIQLKPVLRWVSKVVQVKVLAANHPIGYGLTYITSRETKVAVIPQGYSDGYDRGLSNTGEVLIQGTRCKVLGRVSMNMFTVDVSHLKDVKVEDEVVLLGSQGSDHISAEEIAEKIGTINYEITTRISPLLPRIIN